MREMAVKTATQEERQEYKGKHPLYGHIKHRGMLLTIEQLTDEPKGHQLLKVLAPQRFQFMPDGDNYLLAKDLRQLKAALRENRLETT